MKQHFINLDAEKQCIFFALLGMLMFSIFDASIKYTMMQMPFPQVIFICYVFNILITAMVGLIQKKSYHPNNLRHVVVVCVLNVLEQICFLTGLKYLPFAELFVVILATPMMVLVFSAVFLKEHLRRYQVIAMTLGFLGALSVAASPLLFGGAQSDAPLAVAPDAAWIGWAAAVCNVFMGAIRLCYLRKFAKDENPFSISMLLYVMLLVISGVQLTGADWHFRWAAIVPLALGCIIGNAGLFSYLRAFRGGTAPLVAATQYSQIIWALLMGYFIFHETPTIVGIVGSVLICVSGYFLYLKKYPVRTG